MIEFPFIGGTVADHSDIAFSAQRTVNLYPEADKRYKNQMVLVGFPGYSQWVDLVREIRGVLPFNDHLVAVAGSQVYKVTKGGTATVVGSIDTGTGLVDMDENGLELVIVDGNGGYIWDGETFSQITDSTFTQLKSDSVAYLDSAFIANRPGTGQIYASAALDASTWNAAKTATAEYKSDHVDVVWTDRELLLGGKRTVQVYYNSGASPMPFEPIRQGRLIYGVAAPRSVSILDNTSHALFRDENGGVFAGRLDGYSVRRISPRALDRYWSGIDYQDAYSFGMHWKGHEFYILTFPRADNERGRTFGYDASTQLWFEVGPYLAEYGDFEKFPATAYAFFDRKHVIGDVNGKLHILSDSDYKFDDKEVVSLRRAPILHQNRERIFFNKLQIDMDVGVGTNSGQGLNPQIRLRISDDGGRSFKNYREKAIGATGEYETRVQFHHLGSSYDRVFEVSVSDPVPRKFMGGYVE